MLAEDDRLPWPGLELDLVGAGSEVQDAGRLAAPIADAHAIPFDLRDDRDAGAVTGPRVVERAAERLRARRRREEEERGEGETDAHGGIIRALKR